MKWEKGFITMGNKYFFLGVYVKYNMIKIHISYLVKSF